MAAFALGSQSAGDTRCQGGGKGEIGVEGREGEGEGGFGWRRHGVC